jgi:hypothetical protein
MVPDVNYTKIVSNLKNLPLDQQQLAIRDTVSNLPEDKKVETVTDAAKKLTPDQQQQVAASINVLPPSSKTNDIIWLIVIGSFASILIGIVVIMAVGWFLGKTFEPSFLTIFTSVSAFLIGLFAKSPVS